MSAKEVNPFSIPGLIAGILVAQGVHIAAILTPVTHELLEIGPLSIATWGALLALASLVVVGMEIFKWVKFRI